MIKIIGYIIYGFATILAFAFILDVRYKTKSGRAVERITLNADFCYILALVLVPVFKLSPLHLLWMFPASFIMGPLSLLPPLFLLTPFGKFVGAIACLGMDENEVERNRARLKILRELMQSEDISADEAKKRLEEKGEW